MPVNIQPSLAFSRGAPLNSGWFHLGLLHTILDERLGNFESYYETTHLYILHPTDFRLRSEC